MIFNRKKLACHLCASISSRLLNGKVQLSTFIYYFDFIILMNVCSIFLNDESTDLDFICMLELNITLKLIPKFAYCLVRYYNVTNS